MWWILALTLTAAVANGNPVDSIPVDPAPKVLTVEDAAPEVLTVEDATPEDAAPEDAAPEAPAPEAPAPEDLAPADLAPAEPAPAPLPPPPPPRFRCQWDGKLVPQAAVCNGRHNCFWGEDEHNSLCKNRGLFFCTRSGQLVAREKVCDDTKDCDFGEDESKFICHGEDEFPCSDDVVVNINKRCDGTNDCPMHLSRSADEDMYLCNKNFSALFACFKESKYLPRDQVCDGTVDCPTDWNQEGEDESFYQCDKSVPRKWICLQGDTIVEGSQVCDGNNDCPVDDWIGMGDDENAMTCSDSGEFACSPTETVDGSNMCDGNNDCTAEDEEQKRCDYLTEQGADSYTCTDGTVVSIEQLCDNVTDCTPPDEAGYTCGGRVLGPEFQGMNRTTQIPNSRNHWYVLYQEHLKVMGIDVRATFRQ